MRPLPAARQTRASQCPAEPRRLPHRRHLRGRIPGHRPVLPACHRRLATRTTALDRRDVDAENACRQAPIQRVEDGSPGTGPPSSHRMDNARASRLASNAPASSRWSAPVRWDPLVRNRAAALSDRIPDRAPHPRKELVTRLLKRRCELCEQPSRVVVHQVRALACLPEPGPGQPEWAVLMARKRRKTLVVCRPLPRRHPLTNRRHGVITGEPDARKRASPVRREAARKRTRPAGPCARRS